MLSAGRGLIWRLCLWHWLCMPALLLLELCRAAPHAGTHPRQLHGRFLHITDLHPDPFYKTYSSTEAAAACHRKHGPAGFYGAETSGCDSPLSLVNETFAWINDNLKDTIDFVVWTGDSARHDSDEKIPRTPTQVIEQNELLVAKFTDIFGSLDNASSIPIVPTFGNNDVMPHNIFLAGPNKWTSKYLHIWRNFIPEAQRHQFQQGGWFSVEVIPRKLAVISLNTLYFFDSNSGVDGCADKHEPGYEHMEWLRIQLQMMRESGTKAILIGHVPPARVDSKSSWDETCWQKFTLWQRQYRDIIVASLFGHMNIDHFMLHDFHHLTKDARKGRMGNMDYEGSKPTVSLYHDGEVTLASASDYLLDLRNAWAHLPQTMKASTLWPSSPSSPWQWILSKMTRPRGSNKSNKGTNKKYLKEIGGRYGERFSVSHVSPSVVPNYFPTLRVFEYNITGLEDSFIRIDPTPSNYSNPPLQKSPLGRFCDGNDEFCMTDDINEALKKAKNKKKNKQKILKSKKWKFKLPAPPSKSSPPGPAYSPQSLTLLSYTQWFANLTHINNDFVAPMNTTEELEPDIFRPILGEDEKIDELKWKEGKHHQHQGKRPHPKPHPKRFKFEVEYETKEDKLFRLKDLTVRSYVELARRIGADEDKGKKVDKLLEVDNGNHLDVEKEGKKNKMKGKKHKHSNNKAWLTFVRRAFVGTMDPEDIEDVFGCDATVEPSVEEVESLEL